MRRRLLIILHLIIGLSAIGAGQALARKPAGETFGFETRWLAGSPFRDYRIPGLFLAAVIGGSNLLGAAGLLRRTSWSGTVSLLSGINLMAWLAIQTRIIGLRHWSQGLWWLIFGLLTVLAAGEWRERKPLLEGVRRADVISRVCPAFALF
jgi:hypothetical protein